MSESNNPNQPEAHSAPEKQVPSWAHSPAFDGIENKPIGRVPQVQSTPEQLAKIDQMANSRVTPEKDRRGL